DAFLLRAAVGLRLGGGGAAVLEGDGERGRVRIPGDAVRTREEIASVALGVARGDGGGGEDKADAARRGDEVALDGEGIVAQRFGRLDVVLPPIRPVEVGLLAVVRHGVVLLHAVATMR